MEIEHAENDEIILGNIATKYIIEWQEILNISYQSRIRSQKKLFFRISSSNPRPTVKKGGKQKLQSSDSGF